jgi:transcriptional regulator of met regulon
VLQAFTQSPGKSVRQRPRETGVPKISVNRILQHKKTKPSVPGMFHAMNDDSNRQVILCEEFLHMCDEHLFTDVIVCST